MKRQPKGKQFQNTEDARAFFEDVIFYLPLSAWSGVIDSWFQRMVMCVQAEGGFFKKSGADRVVVSVVEKPDCKT